MSHQNFLRLRRALHSALCLLFCLALVLPAAARKKNASPVISPQQYQKQQQKTMRKLAKQQRKQHKMDQKRIKQGNKQAKKLRYNKKSR